MGRHLPTKSITYRQPLPRGLGARTWQLEIRRLPADADHRRLTSIGRLPSLTLRWYRKISRVEVWNVARHGQVVQFTKGYGFIQPQGGGKDVFVHISAVERAGLSGLNEGQVIEYEEVANKGKTSAENLKVNADFAESSR
jgi:cold shock protein